MPLLIQAVPLAKNWLGGHYWRTPAFDTLPEELEVTFFFLPLFCMDN